MDEETLDHIFEPFFTTKEREHGTGLGLSTVFGIVKQNEGHITVHSRLGEGTTFRIYLPRTSESETRAPSRDAFPSMTHGAETVLVVEDEVAVRDLAVQILKAHGYQVLSADNGPLALTTSEEHDGPIHLLLTDMVMPQMSGKELAEQLEAHRPGLKVLYMTGHGEALAATQGLHQEEMVLITKPFTVQTLTGQVRELLDESR
jgi:CheY-like chemotaxis protein